ncbi:hypothetical protein K8R30_03375 [archaeon]|nr:hypothetical protein [archaeon]
MPSKKITNAKSLELSTDDKIEGIFELTRNGEKIGRHYDLKGAASITETIRLMRKNKEFTGPFTITLEAQRKLATYFYDRYENSKKY